MGQIVGVGFLGSTHEGRGSVADAGMQGMKGGGCHQTTAML